MMEKMAVLAPIPSPNVTTTARVYPRFLSRLLSPYRMSLSNVSIPTSRSRPHGPVSGRRPCGAPADPGSIPWAPLPATQDPPGPAAPGRDGPPPPHRETEGARPATASARPAFVAIGPRWCPEALRGP